MPPTPPPQTANPSSVPENKSLQQLHPQSKICQFPSPFRTERKRKKTSINTTPVYREILEALQEKRAVAAGAKTAAICRLLRRVFGPPLYMRSIAAFFVTAVIGRVFCGVLQRRDIKLPQ